MSSSRPWISAARTRALKVSPSTTTLVAARCCQSCFCLLLVIIGESISSSPDEQPGWKGCGWSRRPRPRPSPPAACPPQTTPAAPWREEKMGREQDHGRTLFQPEWGKDEEEKRKKTGPYLCWSEENMRKKKRKWQDLIWAVLCISSRVHPAT